MKAEHESERRMAPPQSSAPSVAMSENYIKMEHMRDAGFPQTTNQEFISDE